MYHSDWEGEGSGSSARTIGLLAVFGLAAYGLYRLFQNPDAVRRFGAIGDRVAEGVETVKSKAGELGETIKGKMRGSRAEETVGAGI